MQGEAERAARAAAEPGGHQATEERAGAPDAKQRTSRRGVAERAGGRGDADLHGAEQHARGEQDDHQRADGGAAQGAAAPALPARLGTPRARSGLRGKRGRAGEQDGASGGQGDARRDRGAEPKCQRWSEDPGQLDRGRLGGVRGAGGARVGQQAGEQRAHAGAERRGGEPDRRGEQHGDRHRDALGQRGDGAEQRGGHRGAGEQHGRLAAAIDERAEQRAADPQRERVGARDQAGGRERPGQVPGVDEQGDAEHRQRQARDDRHGEEAKGAGARGKC